MNDINIRFSTQDGDADAIRALATLDGSSPPRGSVLVAELDDEPVAAVSIADGHTVADRSRTSSSLLTLLRLRRWEVRLIGTVFGA